MSERRFSKAALLEAMERWRANHAAEFASVAGRLIDPGNGWAQCDGPPYRAAVAYGHWKGLTDLARAIRDGEVP